MKLSDKKRVVLLIPQLRHGGAERVVSRLSYLLNNDMDISIVVFDDSIITYEVGSKITSLNVPPSSSNSLLSKGINIIKRVLRYKKYKNNHNIDITYSFGDTANIINIFSGGKDNKLISIRGYKRIRTGKTLMDRLLLRPLSIYLCKRADQVISVSELITRKLFKEYKLESDKVTTIYNGYEVDKIRELAGEYLTGEEKLLFENNDVVISAGTLRYEKGYWHLIKAFSIALKENNKLRLVILGKDYKNNKEKIIKLIKDLNIENYVYLLGYKKNPYKYIEKSKLYVLSSVFEGFPNALVEAMACGVPVVAADCPSGPREILAPQINLNQSFEGNINAEYGVLVERMNVQENYNYRDIEKCDINLSRAIDETINSDKSQYYTKKSIQRANDFNYKSWLTKQKNALLI